MRSRLIRVGNALSAIVLLAVAVMSVAAFLPYLQTLWPGTFVGLLPGAPPEPLATASLAQGPDAFLVLLTLIVLGVAAVAHLLGIRRRITGAVSFGASLTVALAGIYPVIGVPAPISYGFYLFVAASLAAAMSALVTLVMSFRGTRLALHTAAPAVIALLAVAVMSGASFLPSVQFPWTDGFFSLPSAGGLPAGPLPTASVAESDYAFSILLTLTLLGVSAWIHLVGIHRRISAVASLAASLMALAIAGLYPTTLILGPALIDYGLYLVAAAAAVAVVASLAMVVMSFRRTLPEPRITGRSFAPNNVRGA